MAKQGTDQRKRPSARELSPEAWQELKGELDRLEQIARKQAGIVAAWNDEVRPYYSARDSLRFAGIKTHDHKHHTLASLPIDHDGERDYRMMGHPYVTKFRPDTAALRKDIFIRLDVLSKVYGPALNAKKEADAELRALKSDIKAVQARLYPKKQTRLRDT